MKTPSVCASQIIQAGEIRSAKPCRDTQSSSQRSVGESEAKEILQQAVNIDKLINDGDGHGFMHFAFCSFEL